mmetsp:Transcript_14512/g.23081  ORF Transcript_14512/g.23081 Transcript_14512/m.23081 type:complete len:129 (+) Transcript_14512:1528-1914(+)
MWRRTSRCNINTSHQDATSTPHMQHDQVTNFPDGTSALGVCVSHALCDVHGAFSAIALWAKGHVSGGLVECDVQYSTLAASHSLDRRHLTGPYSPTHIPLVMHPHHRRSASLQHTPPLCISSSGGNIL